MLTARPPGRKPAFVDHSQSKQVCPTHGATPRPNPRRTPDGAPAARQPLAASLSDHELLIDTILTEQDDLMSTPRPPRRSRARSRSRRESGLSGII